MSSSGDELNAYGVGADALVDELSKRLSRRVVDETGLRGKYDFILSWKSDSSAEPIDPVETRIRRALDEQLGLKLDMRKAPVKVVQIESIQRPSEN